MNETEKCLAKHGFCMTATEGDSMAPMFKTGDKILVRKPALLAN